MYKLREIERSTFRDVMKEFKPNIVFIPHVGDKHLIGEMVSNFISVVGECAKEEE